MARITVEDCLKRVESRFELVILAGRRAKMIMKGAKPLIERNNRPIVTALREIAATKVKFVDPREKGQPHTPSESTETVSETRGKTDVRGAAHKGLE